MPRRFRISLFAALGFGPALAHGEDGSLALREHLKPLLQEFCFDCHNAEKQKGDVDLVHVAAEAKLDDPENIWERIAEMVESREMPPDTKPQPTEEQREMLVAFIRGELSKAGCTGPQNPGKVTIRRLNREEYRNSIRDLLGVDFDPEDFPADEVGYGFDNIGDVLSLPPMLMEKYLVAAETIAKKALANEERRLIPRTIAPGGEHACAVKILRDFAARAYRRPVSEAEAERLAGLVEMAMKNGGSFLEGMQVGVQATLCSPHFLFRWELDPRDLSPGETRELNDFEVASRLSYFLWSSVPDAELRALAENGTLRRDGNLEKQTARLLGDWKARAFVSNFAGQWLQIRNLWEVSIDPDAFPGWDDQLKGAMKEETERFFAAFLKEDRPVTELLTADFTFLNEKLARHYGLEDVKGEDFRRVALPEDSRRGGVLTQGSVLLATSHPTRTSPVVRGKWILEQILGTPPPPPPPNVPPLPEQHGVDQAGSVRERLEQHRSRVECAGCHAKIDPLGFALEHFDATGKWRDTDGKFPIDATGKLKSGLAFDGARELSQALAKDHRFISALTEKLMIYALGRGLEPADRCAKEAVVKASAQQGFRLPALIVGIVTSDPFLKRRSDAASTATRDAVNESLSLVGRGSN